MLSETEFTINEVAKAFHRPAFWIRRWIRKGRLQGYLLGGILEDRVEAEALVEFQERNPRYQRAVMSLLKKERCSIYPDFKTWFNGNAVFNRRLERNI